LLAFAVGSTGSVVADLRIEVKCVNTTKSGMNIVYKRKIGRYHLNDKIDANSFKERKSRGNWTGSGANWLEGITDLVMTRYTLENFK